MKSVKDVYGENRDLYDWMSEQNLSIGVAAEGDNDLFLLGHHVDGSQSIFSRKIDGCSRLCVDETGIWVSTRNHIWQFEDCLHGTSTRSGCDRMFLPTLGISTGEVGMEDIVIEAHGRVVFASSSNGSLATVRDANCVVPFWRPPVNNTLFDTTRYQLSGLSLEGGYSKYVTAFERTKRADRWNDLCEGSGLVVDIEANEIVASELSMPRSPRIYDGMLWLLNTGTGHFGFVDFATGNFQEVLGIHGSMESLVFHGDFAIVGITKPGKYDSRARLNCATIWDSSRDIAGCEIQVIDMKRGIATNRFSVPRGIHKINDVVVLPGVRMPGVVRPQAVGFDLNQREARFQVESSETLKQSAVT